MDVPAEHGKVRRLRELLLVELQKRERFVELARSTKPERRNIERRLAEIIRRPAVVAIAERAIRARRRIGSRSLRGLHDQLLEGYGPADPAMTCVARDAQAVMRLGVIVRECVDAPVDLFDHAYHLPRGEFRTFFVF